MNVQRKPWLIIFSKSIFVLLYFADRSVSGCTGYIKSWQSNNSYWYIDNNRLRLTDQEDKRQLFSIGIDGFKIISFDFKDPKQTSASIAQSTKTIIRSFKILSNGKNEDFLDLLCVWTPVAIDVCSKENHHDFIVAFNLTDINSVKPGYTFRVEGKNTVLGKKNIVKRVNKTDVGFTESQHNNHSNDEIWEIKVTEGCYELFNAEELLINTTTTTTTATTLPHPTTESQASIVTIPEKDYEENIENGGNDRLLELEESIHPEDGETKEDIDQKIMNATIEMEKFLLKSADSLSGNVSLKLYTKYFEGEIGRGYTPLTIALEDNYIKAEANLDQEKPITYSTVAYRRLHEKLSDNLKVKSGNMRDTQSNHQINSLLVSLSVKEAGAVSIVSLTLRHKINASTDSNMCAFWNETGLGFWSTEGCTKTEYLSNHSHTACSCNHLTNFAILTSFGRTIPPIHAKILSTLSLVCCGISIIFLFTGLILLAILLTGDRKHSRHFVHFNLMLALFIVQMIFVTGVEATDNRGLCRGIALALHYFLLATFGWMLMEGLHLYVTVIKVFAEAAKKMRFYFVIAWGYPFIVISITAAINIEFYGSGDYCWMNEDGFWSVMGPMLATMLLNTIILIVLVKEIVQLSKTDGVVAETKIAVRSAIFLMPLLGITWIFAILTFYSDQLAFQYIFSITNSLQGFMLTLLHCFCNRDVRKSLKRKAEIWGHSSSASSIRFHSQRISRSHDSYSMSAFRSSGKKTSTIMLLEKNQLNQAREKTPEKVKISVVSFDTSATQLNGE